MKLIFGLELDGPAFPPIPLHSGGLFKTGPKGLLNLLETHLGLAGHPNDEEYLRIHAFRQACLHYLNEKPAFFQHSFQADPFATAADLLQRRDELKLAGWDFQIEPNTPERLAVLAQVEAYFTSGTFLLPVGYADRLWALQQHLQTRAQPFQVIQLVEPLPLLPYYLQELLGLLEQGGSRLEHPAEPTSPKPETDLLRFQQHLLHPGPSGKQQLEGDGRLLILDAQRSTDAAQFVAALLKKNPTFQPLCLIPEKFPALDNAFLQEGLPGLGIQTTSLARPSLQLLKLAPAFLWQPIDPFKVLEFVNLSVKPLDEGLANVIANQIA
ncbi:MAG: hypothetical protein KDC44_00990, partial [Phaeodactylibacter sp.]|nr:hypothetical protein [Phaeodactylibacter sp.]